MSLLCHQPRFSERSDAPDHLKALVLGVKKIHYGSYKAYRGASVLNADMSNLIQLMDIHCIRKQVRITVWASCLGH